MIIDGHWLPILSDDPRARWLFLRHYSSAKNGPKPLHPVGNAAKFVGPGESMALLTEDCRALYIWRRNRFRKDGQSGVECLIFRNESEVLSSELIREADELAFNRWPAERHFTYVEDGKVASTNPGYCFIKAGWWKCGRNADGRLTILERLPVALEQAA